MNTAAKVGGFFLVVLFLAGLLIWRIEDLRLGRGAGQKISEQSKGRGGPEGEGRLRTIIDNIKIITEDRGVMVASNRGSVDATVANFREFSEGMTQLVDRIDKLIASNSANVTQGLSNIKDVSGKLETT